MTGLTDTDFDRSILRRPPLITVILAAGFLVCPPLFLRFGPESVRMKFLELSQGVWSGFGGEERFLRFDAQHQVLGALSGKSTIEFPFENCGDRPVVLMRSWSSCGCIDVGLPGKPIAPGMRSKVVLHVDTGDQLAGPMWMLAKVYTDLEPKRPFLLAAEGTVK